MNGPIRLPFISLNVVFSKDGLFRLALRAGALSHGDYGKLRLIKFFIILNYHYYAMLLYLLVTRDVLI